MPAGRRLRLPPLRQIRQAWPWGVLLLALVGIRLSKGAGILDAYALLSRPFWPGTAQGEWVRQAQRLEDQGQLQQLKADNDRLRAVLQLRSSANGSLEAPVISRDSGGWWQQLLIGQGSLKGVSPGDSVLAPGGLVGRVASVTPTTSSVTLLTDRRSHVGVWVPRTRQQGLLVGVGSGRPVLHFVEKDPGVRPGDLVFTSPASSLVPPNIAVGVVQTVNGLASPAPEAIVQLAVRSDALDWVKVLVGGR
ncbi:rod shape-determining protein MreC [Cyanobium sp. HWJ4-Hawea]|uniref:rod shape-determining protein MreC n=1 Tax=Cyanobium sp. HWJ4-Hawea TaxID=2823713 RepID=UPI0020CF1E58|nr:rod shape-determining protein MreC [Cyanobium sp. HWJ4-Hawea]MCP9808611.1 rod shape-determining protein MreC [Cyanobium sp. HWJ4-Hawea]